MMLINRVSTISADRRAGGDAAVRRGHSRRAQMRAELILGETDR